MSNVITLQVVIVVDSDTDVMVTGSLGSVTHHSRVKNYSSNTNDDIKSSLDAAADEVIRTLLPNN